LHACYDHRLIATIYRHGYDSPRYRVLRLHRYCVVTRFPFTTCSYRCWFYIRARYHARSLPRSFPLRFALLFFLFRFPLLLRCCRCLFVCSPITVCRFRGYAATCRLRVRTPGYVTALRCAPAGYHPVVVPRLPSRCSAPLIPDFTPLPFGYVSTFYVTCPLLVTGYAAVCCTFLPLPFLPFVYRYHACLHRTLHTFTVTAPVHAGFYIRLLPLRYYRYV